MNHYFSSPGPIGRRIAITMCCLLAIAPASVEAVQYRVTDLGANSNFPVTSATDINSSGQVTGWMFSNAPPFRNHAFLWTSQDGMLDLGVIPGQLTNTSSTFGLAINDSGAIAGYGGPNSDPLRNAFYRPPGGPIQDLGIGSFPSGTQLQAADINNLGQVVGSAFVPPNTTNAWMWTSAGGLVDLGGRNLGPLANLALPRPEAINDLGQMVGNINASDAFVWTEDDGYQLLSKLPSPFASFATASDINASGLIVGNSQNGLGQARGVLWTDPTTTHNLGVLLGHNSSFARSINADGQIVGQSSLGANQRAVIWQDTTSSIVDLNTLLEPTTGAGWTLLDANAVNNSGWIVGAGLINGQHHAYLLVPIPEPNSLILSILATTCLYTFRCR